MAEAQQPGMARQFMQEVAALPSRHALVLSWVSAVALPFLSTAATMHVHLLDRIPAALFIFSVAATASFGFVVPTAVAAIVSLLLFNYFIAPPLRNWSLQPEELVREAIWILIASMIAFLIIRSKGTHANLARAEREVRDTLRLVEDQVAALSLAQQAGKSAAWVIDTEIDEVKFLPGSFEIFGFPFSDFNGRRPIDLLEPENRAEVEAAFLNTIRNGTPLQVEFRLKWPNGELHTQEARGVRDPANPKLIRGTTFDITERKQAELSLLRIEKLAAVGRIASTIAHEINNPLASVTNLLYLALLDPSIGAETRAHLLTAEQELSRLSNVTRLTLSYARPQAHASDIDPGEVMDGVLKLFRLRLDSRGIRTERICPRPVRIHLFADELQRIATNLIANAIDAAHLYGGLIRIEISQQEGHAIIAIEDNGTGIAPEHVHRIFEPFFTTKDGVGTGIGLWVTKELVEKNGGVIRLQSAPLPSGMRTRFELRFPIPPGGN